MGNTSICDNTLSNRSGNDRLKNRDAGVVPSAARQSKLCNTVHTWRATRGQAAMVVLHLREIAISTFNRRRRALKRLGMVSRPRFPSRQHLGCELPGARMPLKRLFHRLEHQHDLGLVPRMARAAKLFLPGHQRQQHVFSPLGPPRCHRQLRQVLTHRLPPQIDQGRNAGKLLATLSKVSCFIGNPLVASRASIALRSARHCSSTSFDVWRSASTSRQGCRRRDTLDRCWRQALPTSCQ
jgi:hypothetical protein